MKELFRKFIAIITFRDIPLKKKFLLFSVGSLFWLIVVSAISIIFMFDISSKSKWMVDVINPKEKTINIIIRKLRGASISAHKIALYNDISKVNRNYLIGKARLEDCRVYLETLIKGGKISDISRGTGHFYNEFYVAPIKEKRELEFIESTITNINELEKILEDLFQSKTSNKSNPVLSESSTMERLNSYDILTRDTVSILNEFAINTGKDWNRFSVTIKERFHLTTTLIGISFGIATILSIIFGVLISHALTKPIRAITNQINSLSVGEIDLTKKLSVSSKDEIGSLSLEFNKLMETIGRVTSFKKIIEEDESSEDIYIRLGKIFIEDLGFDNCVIYEVSNSKNSMRVVYPPEAEDLELHCKRDIYLNCDLCRAKRTGHIVTSDEYPNICKYYTEDAKNIHYCIPIIIGGNVGGVVQFVCGQRGLCDVEDMRKKISRARQYIMEAQPVLEAKRLMKTLKESAFKDALTGLYNRRFLEESFESMVAGTLRRGSTMGLLMCDIDFFKQTNDIYGHDVGDNVLKEAATNIKRSVRTSDLVIRFGGEEFLVLLQDIKPGDALEVAEKIRQRIEESKIKIAGGFIQKTISVGVSEFPSDTQNFWEAIKYADVALYKAKEWGRNRVIRFSPEMWAEEAY
jgi:two-component system cell cycle response regulator